jgi:hypothetical protein
MESAQTGKIIMRFPVCNPLHDRRTTCGPSAPSRPVPWPRIPLARPMHWPRAGHQPGARLQKTVAGGPRLV